MKFNIYDMLVFEDESGNIYQDCVCSIEEENVYGVKTIKCSNTTVFIGENKAHSFYIKNNGINYRGTLTEIWTRTDENTYKKVYELIDGELVKIDYYNGMPVYHRIQTVTYEQIKNFTVKESS